MFDTLTNLFSSSDFSGFLFNNLASAIFVVDSDLHVQKVNSAYKTLFSCDDPEILDQLCGNALGCSFAVEQDKQCGKTTECENCLIRSCIGAGFQDADNVQSAYITRTFYIAKKPVLKYFRIKTKKVLWNGKSLAIIALDDITEIEEQKLQIQEMANHDFLTNLYTRRYFFDVAEMIFQNAFRGNITIAIAIFDIDFFKKINDSWGHAAGDFILKSVTEILSRNLRKADILARYGGEEFCLLLHCSDNENAYTVVDKLRLLVEQNVFMYEGKKIDISISAGLTTIMEDSLEKMLRKADEMLYAAKERGRNRTEEYRRETL